MTQSHWQRAASSNAEWKADVAIVGGGLCGLSLAYWLKTLAPHMSVVILEAAEIGHGASGKNAGFNTAGSTFYLANLAEKEGAARAQSYWEFKQESLRLMREHLFSRFQVEQVFSGSTTLYRDENLRQEHRCALESMKAVGLIEVTADSLMKQGLQGVSGLGFSNEGCLHPKKLLMAMADHLQSLGVAIHTQQAVSWGESTSSGVRLLCARGEGVAQHVFLALNGYAGQFHPSLGSWVTPKRAQMIAVKGGPRKLTGNFYDPAQKVYFRQDVQSAEGAILIGGMRLLDEAHENSDFDKTTQVIQTALHRYVEDMFGDRFPVMARWSGIMGFTSVERPYVRAVPFLPHTTFVGGFSGHGMGLAFGTAHEAISQFLGHKTRFEGLLPLE